MSLHQKLLPEESHREFQDKEGGYLNIFVCIFFSFFQVDLSDFIFKFCFCTLC